MIRDLVYLFIKKFNSEYSDYSGFRIPNSVIPAFPIYLFEVLVYEVSVFEVLSFKVLVVEVLVVEVLGLRCRFFETPQICRSTAKDEGPKPRILFNRLTWTSSTIKPKAE